LDRNLTLISASAGYGKTTLAAAWLQDGPRPVAWLSLDQDDSDLVVFLTYVVAAIRTIFPDACPQTQSLGQAPQMPPVDYIHNDLINQLLPKLIDNLPLQMHLVICSRTDPQLPLAKLRVHQQMTEIRTPDLCFSQEEVNTYLEQALGEKPSSETVTLLEEKTEGWIAGLRMAALSMRGTDDLAAFVKTFKGIHHNVMDFLVDEVLSRQSQAVQDFLFQTSLLDRFCVPLCEAVTDHSLARSREILAEMERQNLFLVPLDYERGWYRYHHLFQDFLRRRSEDHLSKEGVATLHCKASAWLAGNGFIDEALRHALAAGDVEGAARVVEESRHAALNREEWATLERWLNLLPEETIQGRPILLVARAWVLDFRYQIAGIPPLLQAAEARLSADPDVWTESARDLQGEIDALWSIVLAWGGQGKPALERALRALKLLPPAYAFVRSFAMLILALAYQMTGQTDTALRVLGDFLTEADALPDTVITRMLICQAYVHIRVGNLHQAAQVLQRLQYVAEKARLTVSIFIANWLLGRISYEWNHLETASQHLPAMFELRYVGHYGMVYDGTTSLVLTYHAQGKPDKAEETLAALRRFALKIGIMERLHFDSFEARLAVSKGDLQPAIRWTETHPVDMPAGYTFVWFELPIVIKTRVLIAQGTEASLHEAVQLLQELLTFAESMHSTYRQIETLAHLALAYQAQGQTDDALQALERSVKLAGRSG
jgi:LuxR family maltose regulon positive regulatory protein